MSSLRRSPAGRYPYRLPPASDPPRYRALPTHNSGGTARWIMFHTYIQNIPGLSHVRNLILPTRIKNTVLTLIL